MTQTVRMNEGLSDPSSKVQGLPDWHDTQNNDYLELLRKRLLEPRLTWVDQFIGLIKAAGISPLRINDFGCNVGHFYRGCQDLGAEASYRGYDISDTYLAIARESFGAGNFELLDFAADDACTRIRQADVAVISATLEHVEDFQKALDNVFATTSRMVLLRTFVGEHSLQDHCLTQGARAGYLIRQFRLAELISSPQNAGWYVQLEMDQATGGKQKMVCNGETVPRTQSILVFTRQGT